MADQAAGQRLALTIKRQQKLLPLDLINYTYVVTETQADIYVHGRHNRGAGFAADLEKYLEAALAGWRVVRLGSNELTVENVGRLVALVSDDRDIHQS